MPIVDNQTLRNVVLEKYNLAKSSLEENKVLLEKYGAISDRIPSYQANKMQFGAFNQDEFIALFSDMRGSTIRSQEIGPAKTFLTMHAVIPTMIYVVEAYQGFIVDIPGDGVMALFKKGKSTTIYWDEKSTGNREYLNGESLAVSASEVLLESLRDVVNPILISDGIPPVEFGVGIATGSVIVTKTGTNQTFDTKAIGDCINIASKYSNGKNEIKLTKATYQQLRKSTQSRYIFGNVDVFTRKIL